MRSPAALQPKPKLSGRAVLLLLLGALGVIFVFSLCIGRYAVSPAEVVRILFYSATGRSHLLDPTQVSVVLSVRLPRILLGIVIGMGLSAAGAAYQGIFGNPLVSPHVLGVASGAGFGASLGILFSGSVMLIQGMSLAFGLLAVITVMLLSRIGNKTQLFVLVLSGVIVTALFDALVSLIKYTADPQDKLPAIVIWLMGSLASASYRDLMTGAVTILVCLGVLLALRWKMNLLSLDEEEAQALGVNVAQVRGIVIVASTLITASAVSVCGIIGWIGLVIPHMGRIMVGNDHRILLPVSTVLGGIYLVLIDNLARTATTGEIPLSILTAIIGAPFFAYMLRKKGAESV
ncbi:iron ABC transporter permease [Oscillospiraceae bacterium MB08-C2-2]|nr:iron ABC transporter permease [Oscillospiraceae bacterium MB08-C2-2]